jgi:hypothetical protein
MLPPKLDYLFTATFRDGSVYHQTPADTSVEHPLTKSAFYDVLQRNSDVASFTLIDRHGQHQHTVFLSDGHFTTDGRVIPCPRSDLTGFRLIYFRRVQHIREGGFQTKPYVQAYFIGWQANDASGKNFQMMLEIPPLGLGKPKLSP